LLAYEIFQKDPINALAFLRTSVDFGKSITEKEIDFHGETKEKQFLNHFNNSDEHVLIIKINVQDG
jgi:hypothetical protein